MPTQIHNIVIVGGGAGGLELATKLGHSLGKSGRANITLVDFTLTHLWKPLWHEVAAGTLLYHADELNYIAHAYLNHFNFEYGELTGLDRQAKQIFLAPLKDENGAEIIPQRSLSYDTLVIAIGSLSHDFNTPGVKEYCTFLDSVSQSEHFHQQLLNKILHSQNQLHAEGATELSIAIVGGGATGVELAAELHYAIRQAARYSRTPVNQHYKIKICIIEAAERILAALPLKVSQHTQQQLEKMGIEVYAGQRVKEVNATGLLTETGLSIAADLKVWAAGVKAPDLLTQLDKLECNRAQQLVVTSTLQTTQDQDIFAFGDCASCPQAPNDERKVPARAQAAHQQALLMAKNLKRRLAGKALQPYRYKDYGSLISLSQRNTVGNLMGALRGSLFIEGKIARLVYLSLYKKHQMALHGFWHVFLMTLADLIGYKIKPRLKLH